MQKITSIALLAGALILAAALVYHGRQLMRVSAQIEAMQKQNAALENRLDRFSDELPGLIAEGAKDAGRQVVQGIVEETIEKPLKWVSPKLLQGTSNILQRVIPSAEAVEGLTNRLVPLIRFDIPQPVINIGLLPNLKELPAWPWFSGGSRDRSQPTNQSADAPTRPETPVEPK